MNEIYTKKFTQSLWNVIASSCGFVTPKYTCEGYEWNGKITEKGLPSGCGVLTAPNGAKQMFNFDAASEEQLNTSADAFIDKTFYLEDLIDLNNWDDEGSYMLSEALARLRADDQSTPERLKEIKIIRMFQKSISEPVSDLFDHDYFKEILKNTTTSTKLIFTNLSDSGITGHSEGYVLNKIDGISYLVNLTPYANSSHRKYMDKLSEQYGIKLIYPLMQPTQVDTRSCHAFALFTTDNYDMKFLYKKGDENAKIVNIDYLIGNFVEGTDKFIPLSGLPLIQNNNIYEEFDLNKENLLKEIERESAPRIHKSEKYVFQDAIISRNGIYPEQKIKNHLASINTQLSVSRILKLINARHNEHGKEDLNELMRTEENGPNKLRNDSPSNFKLALPGQGKRAVFNLLGPKEPPKIVNIGKEIPD